MKKKRNKKGKKTSNQSREEKSSESILEDGKSKALTLNFSLKVRLTQNKSSFVQDFGESYILGQIGNDLNCQTHKNKFSTKLGSARFR